MSDDKKEKTKILVGLAEIYGFSFSTASLLIYLNALSDKTAVELAAIVNLGVKSNAWKFMPKPGELLTFGAVPDSVNKNILAKQLFQKILRAATHGSKLSLSEPEQSVLRLSGGFETFRMSSDQELVWLEKRFVENFENLSTYEDSHQMSDEVSKMIGGIAARLNGK